MPTYEYECQKCGIHFDRRQRMSDPPLQVCPECGGTVKRLISAGSGVIFKGSGFHSTGYPKEPLSCGRDTPCCGRDTLCERKPCDGAGR